MGTLWVKCPATGRIASTGIVTDWVSFDKLPDRPKYTRCPGCGMHHEWLKGDAWLSDAADGSEKSGVAAQRFGAH
jgi:hypothetical protein